MLNFVSLMTQTMMTVIFSDDESSSDENEMIKEEDYSDNSKEGLNDVSESDDGNSRSSDE